MPYDFTEFKKALEGTKDWLSKELQAIRTGRATPAVLDGVMVDSYGTKSPISHVANVGIEGPQTLRVTPWDKTQVKNIESAITSANLGLSVVADGDGLRINFPELTSDRRATFLKLAKEKLEQAKVSVRKEREAVISGLEQKEKSSEISEDEKFTFKDEAQKMVDGVNKELEEQIAKKEKELSE